ncbi:hypothetical protein D3C74_268320 [compost metagenome]
MILPPFYKKSKRRETIKNMLPEMNKTINSKETPMYNQKRLSFQRFDPLLTAKMNIKSL